LVKSYTPNQTGAIACLLAINVWGFTAYIIAPYVSYIIPWFFPILMIIGWVLLPFYIKLSKYTFLVGIFITIAGMTYISVAPNLLGGAKWYLFTRGLWDFSVFYST